MEPRLPLSSLRKGKAVARLRGGRVERVFSLFGFHFLGFRVVARHFIIHRTYTRREPPPNLSPKLIQAFSATRRGRAVHPFLRPRRSITVDGMQYTGSRSSKSG